MKEFKPRKNTRRLLYAPVAIIVLLVVVFFLSRAVSGVYKGAARSATDLSGTKQSLAELEGRRVFLSDSINRFSSERGVEEDLRSKFPVVKEGEKMVIIVDPDESATDGTVSVDSGGFWSRIFDFFRE